MNTPSKEALDAACDLFKHRYCYGSDNDNAAIIDRHFEPLRRRAEQAEARVGELEDACAELVTDANAVTLAANLARQSKRVKEVETDLSSLRVSYEQNASQCVQLVRDNAELKKQEAESRRLFYAEQDKRQSAEFRYEELAWALRELLAFSERVSCGPDSRLVIDLARDTLARHAGGEPEAQK